MAKKAFIEPVKNYTEGARPIELRSINERWNLVVYDDGAEVFIPASWRISASDCPNGLHPEHTYVHKWDYLDEKTATMTLKQLD